MHLTVSPGSIVHKKMDFLDNIIIWSYVHLKFENFSKTLLFEFLNFSKTLLFCSFITFKRTQGTEIASKYIYFTKTTNMWIVCDITRPF